MPPLHRHQLAYLSAAGWQDVLAKPCDADMSPCLRHWAAQRLPLVIATQPGPRPDARSPLALGLAAPRTWQRRRLALRATPAQIAWFAEFPTLDQVLPRAARDSRPALQSLHGALHRLDVRARVFGSTGWQHLTGLPYLHEHSDLDLWLAVDDAEQADEVAAVLQACRAPVRIDGELKFPHGGSVAWREWAAWRAGRCRSVLVKRLDGAALVRVFDDALAPWPQAA